MRDDFITDGILAIPQKKTWKMINTNSKKYLSNTFKTKPIFINDTIHGINIEDKSVWVQAFNYKKEKITSNEKLPPNDMKIDLHNLRSPRFSILMDGNPSYMLEVGYRSRASQEALWIFDNLVTGTITQRGLPDTGMTRDCLFNNTDLLLLREKDVLHLKRHELEALAEKSPFLSSKSNTIDKINLDGFMDEWPTKMFSKIGKNYFAATVTNNTVTLALLIADQNIIKQVGTLGLDNRFELIVMPGSMATFRDDFRKNAIILRLGDAIENKQLSYSVKPSGRILFMEIEIPLEKKSKIDRNILKGIACRERRGDLAFDIIFKDSDGEDKFFLAPKNYATYFPRILLPRR
jgi:hypothetical protein